MQETLRKYRERIRTGQVNPLAHWDRASTGLIFDPNDDSVPLTMLGFGACRLDDGPHRFETKDREFALVPVTGKFEVSVGPEVYKGRREGGPFATLPGESNACAIYIPSGASFEVRGTGELVYFTAPADGHKPPTFVARGQRPNLPRGTGVWFREVITLFTPEDVTTVLVGGETYSWPGLWSGTPLHVHDRDDPDAGESDHEEVYFHLARNTGGQWGPFGVQMLFDNQGLDNAYVVHDRDAFAIPGAAHPVIAGPNSDLLYIWALAGPSSSLGMRDVPEFAYLKKVGAILDQLTAVRKRPDLPSAEFQRVIADAHLEPDQAHILRMYLKQQGIEVT